MEKQCNISANRKKGEKDMEKFMHYEEEIICQCTDSHTFEKTLKEKGVKYHYLPLEKEKVIKYWEDEKRHFAYFHNETYVFITDSIPDDMNWENIYYDYKGQAHNEEPMKLPTRAKVLCQKAEERLNENKEFTFENFYKDTSESELNMSLIHLGSSLEEIREMDHHDVDFSFLK